MTGAASWQPGAGRVVRGAVAERGRRVDRAFGQRDAGDLGSHRRADWSAIRLRNQVAGAGGLRIIIRKRHHRPERHEAVIVG